MYITPAQLIEYFFGKKKKSITYYPKHNREIWIHFPSLLYEHVLLSSLIEVSEFQRNPIEG